MSDGKLVSQSTQLSVISDSRRLSLFIGDNRCHVEVDDER